jgi:hypothetical protein
VSQFALTIAENLIRKELTGDKAQAEMVEQLLNELEHKN